jgi:hypothetical protein
MDWRNWDDEEYTAFRSRMHAAWSGENAEDRPTLTPQQEAWLIAQGKAPTMEAWALAQGYEESDIAVAERFAARARAMDDRLLRQVPGPELRAITGGAA